MRGASFNADHERAFKNGFVESADGTKIGYRTIGTGSAVVLLHGGGATSLTLTTLGERLAERFSVYIPDRRGRGLSGHGAGTDNGLREDIQDAKAVVQATGARKLFGVSAGAVLALQTALNLPEIAQLALFEPPLYIDEQPLSAWVPRYERELQQGRRAAALVTIIKGTEGVKAPRFILVPMMGLILRRADGRARQRGVEPFSDLVPAMRRDIRIVSESVGRLDRFNGLRCPVLLLSGSMSPQDLRAATEQLAGVLPNAHFVTIPGVGHRAANNDGKPQLVAEQLIAFFGKDAVA